MGARAFAAVAAAGLACTAAATERIVPVYPEVGVGGAASSTGEAGTGLTGAGPAPQGGEPMNPGVGSGSGTTPDPFGSGGGAAGTVSGDAGSADGGSVVTTASGQQVDTTATLASMSYGSAALNTANQLGENINSLSSIAYAESRMQNIPTQLGTSAATGPWQFVPATFTSVSNQYGLGYTAADITNPQAQAVEAAYLLRDTANSVSAATGAPATTLQTYMGWVFGDTAASRIATSPGDTLLASLMLPTFLQNNNLPLTTTVSQVNQLYGQRLGTAANQPVLAPSH